jgi:hypothetical protein
MEAREKALTDGYAINRDYDCIGKASFEGVQSAARESKAAAEETPAAASPEEPTMTLAEARSGFRTHVAVYDESPLALPKPPVELFMRIDYTSSAHALPAFVTPDPKDGRKHAAIVWLTGGDTNSLDDFWTPGPDENDQSVHAFRDAGIVMMFPVLRGGNGDRFGKEYFYGEVDDVLAAADRLAQQPYVDPKRIYLGGHSTGGTLALLAAEMSGRFSAVFAFGPVANVDRYPESVLPVKFADLPEDELRMRSPVHWLHGLSSPTYIIEGKDPPGNIDELEVMCATERPLLRCIEVQGRDHFGMLTTVSRVIAARLAMASEGIEFKLRPDDFNTRDTN